MGERFDNDDHALLCGYLLGYLAGEGIAITPVTVKEGFTPEFDIVLPSHRDVPVYAAGRRIRIRVLGETPPAPF